MLVQLCTAAALKVLTIEMAVSGLYNMGDTNISGEHRDITIVTANRSLRECLIDVVLMCL